MNPINPLKLTKRFISVAKTCSLIVMSISIFVLAGWAFDISPLKTVLPGLATMKVNTALALFLSGMALWLSSRENTNHVTLRIMQICNGVVLLIGLLTLNEYIFRLDLGIDQLLFKDFQTSPEAFPGRMAFASALCLGLIGLASILIHTGSKKSIDLGQYLAVAVLAVSLLALVGYIYGVQVLYKLSQFSTMALHTAAGFALLAIGTLSVRQDQGWMRILSTETAGGILLRKLLPLLFGIPIFLGWLIVLGSRAGLYATYFGIAMLAILTAGLLIIILWWNSRQLNLVDIDRRRAEDELRSLNADLEQRVTDRTDSLQSSLNFIYALFDVLQSVISFENLREVLQSVVEAVIRIVSADRVTVFTLDQDARQITNFVKAGPGIKNVVESIHYDELMEGLTGWVMRELRPAVSPKGEPDPRESPFVQQRRRESNCGSIVVFPLVYLGEVLGTMTVINTPQQPDFTPQQVSWMEAIASQASAAIGRVQTMERLKKANLLLEKQGERLEQELLDRKHAEVALAQERDLLQALMDNIPDTIYFKDTLSRFTRINRAQVNVLGVATPEEAIGKTDADFFSAQDLAKGFYEEEQQIVKSGKALTNRIEFNPTPEGQPRWFSATKVPIKDDRGNVIGIVGVSRDITSQKHSEEALRQSEERFRLMSWATKDALWDWDLRNRQILWGEGLQKMFRYPSETQQTEPEWKHAHIHPQDREKVDRSMNQALQGGLEFWSKEYRFQRFDGTYADVMDRGYILRDNQGSPYRMIGAMMDITERRQAEATILQQNEMLSSLHQITLDLLSYREIKPLLDALVELAAKFMDASYVEIMLVDDATLAVQAATQNQHHLIGERVGREEAVLSWKAVDTREPVVLSDYETWPHRRVVYDAFQLHAVADFPILNDNQCLGVLALGREKPDHEFNLDQIQYGRLFANLTALVLHNAQLRDALREQSIRDGLTGLYNRRYMEETLKQQLSRATRQLHPLGIIMLDIDHFKSINDTYGHATGDALLRELGKLLKSNIRNEDIACRYGGEEFLLIMPDTSLETAVQRAELLRQSAHGLHVQEGQLLEGITLSLGVAIYPQHGPTAESVLNAADAALYRAKQAGRDRVVTADTH